MAEAGEKTVCDRCLRRVPWRETKKWKVVGDRAFCPECAVGHEPGYRRPPQRKDTDRKLSDEQYHGAIEDETYPEVEDET